MIVSDVDVVVSEALVAVLEVKDVVVNIVLVEESKVVTVSDGAIVVVDGTVVTVSVVAGVGESVVDTVVVFAEGSVVDGILVEPAVSTVGEMVTFIGDGTPVGARVGVELFTGSVVEVMISTSTVVPEAVEDCKTIVEFAGIDVEPFPALDVLGCDVEVTNTVVVVDNTAAVVVLVGRCDDNVDNDDVAVVVTFTGAAGVEDPGVGDSLVDGLSETSAQMVPFTIVHPLTVSQSKSPYARHGVGDPSGMQTE